MHGTFNDIYMRIYKRLSVKFPDGAPDMAREIVCHAFNKPRADFHKIRQLYTIETKDDEIENYVELCMSGRPLAYIFGEWDFYGLNLEITPDVLIPRQDTEVLAESAINRLKSMTTSPKVLDLCTGSGCLGLAIAKNIDHASVTLLDKSREALEVAGHNVSRLRLQDRVSVVRGDLLRGPEGDGLSDFNMIISNPPYIPSNDIKGLDESVRSFEPVLALDGGSDGLKFYRAIVDKWTGVLRSGGQLMVECGYDQAESVVGILLDAGYTDVFTTKDLSGIERVVSGRRPTRLRAREDS